MKTMAEDKRCCGAGVCIINAAGECWCGQRWTGEAMCRAELEPPAGTATEAQRRTPGNEQAKQ